MLELGLGLIRIARKWGVQDAPIPTEAEALSFLDAALGAGIRYFDTAPAYAKSEEILGTWLKTLSPDQRSKLSVATKMGEFWDFKTESSYKQYDFSALKSSIDQSVQLLGTIDILQLHGTTAEVLATHLQDIEAAWKYAQSMGVKKFGASISNLDALEIVTSNPLFEVIQVPHNLLNPLPPTILQNLKNHGKDIVTNRPMGMGELAAKGETERQAAFRFLVETIEDGIVLTGTALIKHLHENVRLFKQAQAEIL
ncbi:MAG TPA: aldo/keto reductase [Vitreimonas sp.]|nr:aldo/keto reductase [Vitreimonas sp.]